MMNHDSAPTPIASPAQEADAMRPEREQRHYKIVYCTPALYMAGGVERVLTLKANYLADRLGHDVTIILTEGAGKPLFYPLSPRVRVVQLALGFEQLWHLSFWQKIPVYLLKQWRYRRRLSRELLRLRPDITVSLLRREVNFIGSIADGSRKIGELHVNRAHYRNFETDDAGWVRRTFARWWMHRLEGHLARLSRLVVLTPDDASAWTMLTHVDVIPNPLAIAPAAASALTARRIVVVGRYSHEKGFDLLLQAWQQVQQARPDWRLDIFGDGDRQPYELMARRLGLDDTRCRLHGRTTHVEAELMQSALSICSSRFEGFGMAIAEAMACGVPVVAFDCPWGPRNIITHDVDGLLVPPADASALAQAVVDLTGDQQRLAAMGAHARRNMQRFAIDNVMAQWQQLFDSVMDSPSPQTRLQPCNRP